MQAFTKCFAVSMQLYCPRHKTAHRALQWLFLRLCPLNCTRYQTDTSGYNTICATLEGIRAPGHAQPIPDTTATPERCTGQHSRPIIIRYIKGCSIPQTVPARRGQLLPSADRWQVLHPAHLLRGQHLHLYGVSPAACNLAPVSSAARTGSVWRAIQRQGRGGRRGTIDGYRRISFRAFAR